MENNPGNTTPSAQQEIMRPSLPLESDTARERGYYRRLRSKWNTRRREAAANMFRWILLMSPSRFNRRAEMNMMGRWIVEESAATEPDISRRSQRRALLMQRWRTFAKLATQDRRKR